MMIYQLFIKLFFENIDYFLIFLIFQVNRICIGEGTVPIRATFIFRTNVYVKMLYCISIRAVIDFIR